jgi:hypothetical protein
MDPRRRRPEARLIMQATCRLLKERRQLGGVREAIVAWRDNELCVVPLLART